MTTFITPTFDFSGDLEWAAWSKGVLCSDDACHADSIEAIGIAIKHFGDRIKVTPVCKTCVDSIEPLFLFEEDN